MDNHQLNCLMHEMIFDLFASLLKCDQLPSCGNVKLAAIFTESTQRSNIPREHWLSLMAEMGSRAVGFFGFFFF